MANRPCLTKQFHFLTQQHGRLRRGGINTRSRLISKRFATRNELLLSTATLFVFTWVAGTYPPPTRKTSTLFDLSKIRKTTIPFGYVDILPLLYTKRAFSQGIATCWTSTKHRRWIPPNTYEKGIDSDPHWTAIYCRFVIGLPSFCELI